MENQASTEEDAGFGARVHFDAAVSDLPSTLHPCIRAIRKILPSVAIGGRSIIAPGGIKKVGQEVLNFQVNGASISGTVRSELGGAEIRTYRLDTTTHQFTKGERIDTHAR